MSFGESRSEGRKEQVEETHYDWPGARRNLALWFALLAGPLAWAVRLTLGYILVASDCTSTSRGTLLTLSLVTLVVTLAGGLVGWRMLRSLGVAPDTLESPVSGRERFMALGGVALSALFTVLGLATALPTFLLRPCDF
jgi:hypothetical protein